MGCCNSEFHALCDRQTTGSFSPAVDSKAAELLTNLVGIDDNSSQVPT